MTLPTGTIYLSQVNEELGRGATTYIDLNWSEVRALAGNGGGAISMNDLRGKSSVTFDRAAGTYDIDDYSLASFIVNCNKTAAWSYVQNSGAAVASIPANGGSGTRMNVSLTTPNRFTIRRATVTLTGTAQGVSRTWVINLAAYGADLELGS